jgi:hypothetical protein
MIASNTVHGAIYNSMLAHHKSNMKAAKPKIVITQTLDEIEVKFQWIRKCGPEETYLRPLSFPSYICFMLG